MEIAFSIRSIHGESAFRARWIQQGILEDEPGYVFRPAYMGVEITAAQGHPGVLTVGHDENGAPINVAGWHANAYARGAISEAMTAELPQVDESGNLLPLFQRTWVSYVFSLLETPGIDPDSGFPYQATVEDGAIQYGDLADIATPMIVRL